MIVKEKEKELELEGMGGQSNSKDQRVLIH